MNKEVPVTLSIRGKRAAPHLWFRDGEEISLGCTTCPEREVCGGISIRASTYNCMDLCCNEPTTCVRYVCPHQRRYSNLVNEVGGFKLNPYRREIAKMGAIPDFVPYMLDAGTLAGPLSIPVAAISLYSIIDHHTGVSKYESRQQLLERFKLEPSTRLIITSTDEDRRVENFWHVLKLKQTAESLAKLRPSLIATPNFSMHVDTVRHDNLVSMSRIAFCLESFANAGMPVALHVNGRTPFDFNRWAEYLNRSLGIYALAYELGTVGGSHSRRKWHVAQLTALAARVERPLTLLLRAGSRYLPELSQAFHRVILVDSTPLMKAKYRQSGFRIRGKLHWEKSPTEPGEKIDALFLHNVKVIRRATRETVSGALAKSPEQK